MRSFFLYILKTETHKMGNWQTGNLYPASTLRQVDKDKT